MITKKAGVKHMEEHRAESEEEEEVVQWSQGKDFDPK